MFRPGRRSESFRPARRRPTHRPFPPLRRPLETFGGEEPRSAHRTVGALPLRCMRLAPPERLRARPPSSRMSAGRSLRARVRAEDPQLHRERPDLLERFGDLLRGGMALEVHVKAVLKPRPTARSGLELGQIDLTVRQSAQNFAQGPWMMIKDEEDGCLARHAG